MNTYFLSYASIEALDFGIIEFDTYADAFDAYQVHKISGYDVVIRDIGFQSELANEIRKGKDYQDRRTVVLA